MESIKRNILLNPGPSTTTDTVKYAQVVPDICPREKEFGGLMKGLREDLTKIVHGDLEKYTSVLFCGSGTINIDVCINSLLPEGKKVLVVDNGAYSARAVEICQYYGLPYIDLKFPVDEQPDLAVVEQTLKENPDIGLVHTTHNETGTGILNPIREIGSLAHKYNAIFTVDTTSTYAMRPINIEEDNIDFCMASAQKGLMSFTGLSFVVGNKAIIEASKDFPKRSYYCNLYLQYEFFEKTGEMHFTPPVQTIYATIQALKEYKAEIAKSVQEELEQLRDDDIESKLVDALAEKVQGEIPEAMYTNKLEDMLKEFDLRLRSQGLDLDTYMKYTGLTKESFNDQYRDEAEKRVKLRLALEKIAEIEKIEVTEEDLGAEYDKMAEMYKMDADKVKSLVPADDLKLDVAVSKAMDLVKENAVIK